MLWILWYALLLLGSFPGNPLVVSLFFHRLGFFQQWTHRSGPFLLAALYSFSVGVFIIDHQSISAI